jgi:hypothetical protein
MHNDFAGLDGLNIRDHGDARERDVWPAVSAGLSGYELFWRAFIALLTNRVVPGLGAGPEWIRLRAGIPREYEQLAMHNYSLFYFAATARRSIDENRQFLLAGAYPHPERTFFALQASVEQAKELQNQARKLLLALGMKVKLPKHPESLYQSIRSYRNAFTHDPVLGRAVGHGRELLPPHDRLPQDGSPFLWSDAARIPAGEMIDGSVLENEIWQEFSIFLQTQWTVLMEAFVEVRQNAKFRADLDLATLLPICNVPPALSLAGSRAASGDFVARSDGH